MGLQRIDSIELSKYILALAGNAAHLKLQKLVYYTEAYHLAYFEESLIDDQFEAWLHGPVSRKLWNYYKERSNIYDPIICDVDRDTLIADVERKLTEDQIELINDVFKEYGQESAYALECMTHKEGPWLNARKGYAADDKCEVVIDKETMKTFYQQYLYPCEA